MKPFYALKIELLCFCEGCATATAVIGYLSVQDIQSLKSFFFMWLKSFSGIGLQLQFLYATNAILLVL